MHTSFASVCFILKLNDPNNTGVNKFLDDIRQVIALYNILEVTSDSITPSTLIVSLGGDGTLLTALHLSSETGAACIGVNFGHVGFLAELDSTSGAIQTLLSVMRGIIKPYVEQRTLVQATVPGGGKVVGCNEVAISRDAVDCILEYDWSVNSVHVATTRANAVLVSTATGSTAYALSAGGSLMMPTATNLQLVAVAPIKLTSRPILMSPQDQIIIISRKHTTVVKSDGFRNIVVPPDTPITINRAETSDGIPVVGRLLRINKGDFFSTLSSKLGW